MLSTADRYILREVLRPFSLSLLVFTFLLMIPPIMEVAEELIVKGADGLTILKLMGTLVPQARLVGWHAPAQPHAQQAGQLQQSP